MKSSFSDAFKRFNRFYETFCLGWSRQHHFPKMSAPAAVDSVSCDIENKTSYGTLCPAVAMYGPYNVEDLEPGKTMKWCTCGLSKKQPWCDGAHKKTGFKSLKWKVPEKPQRIYSICACKHTKSPPLCDGTHINLPSMIGERQKKCTSVHESNIKLCTGCGWIPEW